MGNMNVHLVMAMVAFAGARTRHQLRLRTHWLELDYLAQLDVTLGGIFVTIIFSNSRVRVPAAARPPT
jgi:hypothetical protein